VFSVPSVSLWAATYPTILDDGEDDHQVPVEETEDEADSDDRPPEFPNYEGDELAAFANRYLIGKLVCIVPDADAHTKPEVMTQALLCRSSLRRLGARAEIVLPPGDRLLEGIKGIDDYLGKGGGNLDSLVWYEKEPPSDDDLEQWLQARGGRRRSDGMRRAVDTVQALATHAGDNGEYSASIRLLGRAMGRQRTSPSNQPADWEPTGPDPKRAAEAARRRFSREIENLLDLGAITGNKPLNFRVGRWLRSRSGWHREAGFHWDEDEVVITIHPDLRAPAALRSIRDLT
jgi:hypothetical protein